MLLRRGRFVLSLGASKYSFVVIFWLQLLSRIFLPAVPCLGSHWLPRLSKLLGCWLLQEAFIEVSSWLFRPELRQWWTKALPLPSIVGGCWQTITPPTVTMARRYIKRQKKAHTPSCGCGLKNTGKGASQWSAGSTIQTTCGTGLWDTLRVWGWMLMMFGCTRIGERKAP